jgi:hypothetical protein
MKRFAFFLSILLFIGPAMQAQTSFYQWAQTPPMGWNSYNCFGSAVHEDEVKANADYMAQHLKQHGWQYVVVDFLWAYDNPPGSVIGNPFQRRLQDGSYVPWLNMDAYGRLIPQEKKFPSSWPDKGFKPLADYVHSLGLKFGIHVMRGIPRQAVWAKSPVLGADGITADMIADTSSICTWLNHMYGLDMSKRGAQEYLNSLLKLYAAWGVDYIKVDDISRPYHKAEVEGYRKAIDQCGRPIVLSLSPGETPVADSAHVATHANLWRVADDFWDNWKEIVHMFDYAHSWQGVGGAGHWPDCDMMQIGKLSKRGPVGPERYSRFTEDELYTHMTLWSIYRSPLMLGGNLPENRELEERLLTNDEVLAVNQQGESPREVYRNDSCIVWVSKAPGKNAWNVALFNLNSAPHNVIFDFASIGWKGKARIRDLWTRKDIGRFRKTYQRSLAAHGAALLKVEGE